MKFLYELLKFLLMLNYLGMLELSFGTNYSVEGQFQVDPILINKEDWLSYWLITYNTATQHPNIKPIYIHATTMQ